MVLKVEGIAIILCWTRKVPVRPHTSTCLFDKITKFNPNTLQKLPDRIIGEIDEDQSTT